MAASICLFSALVSFRFSDNTVYLLVEIFLSLQKRIEVVGFIRSLFRAKEADLYDVPDNLFKWLSVLFVHSQKHERQQNDNHNDGCRARVHYAFAQKKQWDSHSRTGAESHELAFCEVEHDLCLNCV